MTARRILRHQIPVDDRWHRIEGSLAPLHVGCRKTEVVEFWAWEWPEDPTTADYMVIGTGQPVDDVGVQHVGTTYDVKTSYVWHLVRRMP